MPDENNQPDPAQLAKELSDLGVPTTPQPSFAEIFFGTQARARAAGFLADRDNDECVEVVTFDGELPIERNLTATSESLIYDPDKPLKDLLARIDHNFTHHPPKDSDQVAVYERLRAAGKAFATEVAQLVPLSREQSEALTLIESAVLWANAGVARNG